MPTSGKPLVNPLVILREEFDDWAVLFDPDSGKAFGLNPIGVIIWKHLDGAHTPAEIAAVLRNQVEDAPENLQEDIVEFINVLVEQGLAGYELNGEK